MGLRLEKFKNGDIIKVINGTDTFIYVGLNPLNKEFVFVIDHEKDEICLIEKYKLKYYIKVKRI